MERTVVIQSGEKEIELTLKATMSTLRQYRAEFNADLIKDLNEAWKAMNQDPFMDALQRSGIQPVGMTQEEIVKAVMENIDVTALSSNVPELIDGMIQMKAMQCVWAMVRSADKETPKFEKWCDSFEDLLPLKEIVNTIYEMWNTANGATVELKN